MDATNTISDASLYTDFNGLKNLKSRVANHENTAESLAESRVANKEVAKQFESLFLQMMLKSMRDATISGESAESDQTRFYQEMFDKQIALDLASNENGGGLGIAAMLEKDIGIGQHDNLSHSPEKSDLASDQIDLVRNQLNRSSAVIQTQSNSIVDTEEE